MTAETTAPEAEPLVVVPLRHWGRWIAAVVLLALLGCLVAAFVTNRTVEFGTVRYYLFDHRILSGVLVTIRLTVIAQAIGIVLGIVLAVMRRSANPVLSSLSWLYIWFFRGTPLLVQLIFWFYFGALYSHIDVGIPFTHVHAAEFDTNKVLPGTIAAYVALSLNEGAYMAEIVRGGLLAVDEGQTEAALSLGMRRGLVLRRIVLPQAIRVIIPPTGNELISMLKNTSLVSVIAGLDLFTQAQTIYGQNLEQIPLLIVASLWYLAITSVLSVGQYFLERRYSRGSARPPEPLFWRRFRSLMSARHAQAA